MAYDVVPATTLWTCDRCGRASETKQLHPAPGWWEVTFRVGDKPDKNLDLCEACGPTVEDFAFGHAGR